MGKHSALGPTDPMITTQSQLSISAQSILSEFDKAKAEVIKNPDQGLKIIALEDNQDLQEKVLSVFHAATVTFETTQCVKMVENHEGRGVFNQLNFSPPPMLMGLPPDK